MAAREYEDRRRRGFKATWRDKFAWLTYEPAPADSDSNGAPAGAPAATGSASSAPVPLGSRYSPVHPGGF